MAIMFNEKQIKGIDISIKSVAKKFPFITGWGITDDYEKYETTLYIFLTINNKKLQEYLNIDTDLRVNFVDKSSALLVNFDWGEYESEKWDKIGEISYNTAKEISNQMREFYKNLPEEYKINYRINQSNNEDYPIWISFDYYIFTKD